MAERAENRRIVALFDGDGEPMKFEIVSEGRIDLAGVDDPALPVARLSGEDLVAERLLANEEQPMRCTSTTD